MKIKNRCLTLLGVGAVRRNRKKGFAIISESAQEFRFLLAHRYRGTSRRIRGDNVLSIWIKIMNISVCINTLCQDFLKVFSHNISLPMPVLYSPKVPLFKSTDRAYKYRKL